MPTFGFVFSSIIFYSEIVVLSFKSDIRFGGRLSIATPTNKELSFVGSSVFGVSVLRYSLNKKQGQDLDIGLKYI